MENKQVLRLTEADLHQMIKESVYAILSENMEDEGWLDNMKSAFKGARQGFQTQKAMGTDTKTGYSRNSRMSPQEAPSNDAVEKVRQYYAIAKDYLTKYNQMKAKADAIAKQYGIKSTGTGMNKNFDYDVSTEFQGNKPDIKGRHGNFQTKAVQQGAVTPRNAWHKKGNRM